MKNIRLLSVAAALFGITVISSAQTLQEVVEARNKGVEFMAAGNLDGAIAELEKCVELAKKVGGDDAEDHQIVAESALPNLYLRKANQINATGDRLAFLKALEATIAAAVKYNSADVKESAEKVIPQIYYQLGATDFQAQKFEEAIKNLDQAIARDPNMAAAYFVRGACYQQLKDEPKMEENYKLAIEKGDARGRTQLISYFNNAGATAQKAQRWDDAIAALSKTIEVDNANLDAYYGLVVSYNNKKNWDSVISNAEKVLELGATGDRLNGANFYLGTAYIGKSANAKACEHFKLVGEGPFLANAKYQIETVLKCK